MKKITKLPPKRDRMRIEESSEWQMEVRNATQARFAFVPDPMTRARWVRTHRCANWVDCAACDAKRGHPCYGPNGMPTQDVHPARKDLFYKRVEKEILFEKLKKVRATAIKARA